jgi:hypothetical protein
MRGHFGHLHFETFPMTPRTPQGEVFWALLLSSEHSGVPEDSNSRLFQVLGFTPTLGQSRGATNDSTNGLDPTGVPKVQKPKSRVRKLRGSDLKWSNPYGNQVAHFVGYTKSLNVQNFYCNCKKTGTTSYVRPTICVSSTNKGKTQVR